MKHAVPYSAEQGLETKHYVSLFLAAQIVAFIVLRQLNRLPKQIHITVKPFRYIPE